MLHNDLFMFLLLAAVAVASFYVGRARAKFTDNQYEALLQSHAAEKARADQWCHEHRLEMERGDEQWKEAARLRGLIRVVRAALETINTAIALERSGADTQKYAKERVGGAVSKPCVANSLGSAGSGLDVPNKVSVADLDKGDAQFNPVYVQQIGRVKREIF